MRTTTPAATATTSPGRRPAAKEPATTTPWTPPAPVVEVCRRFAADDDGYVTLSVYDPSGAERTRAREDNADVGEPLAWVVTEVQDLLLDHPGRYTHARVRLWAMGGRAVAGARFRLPDTALAPPPLVPASGPGRSSGVPRGRVSLRVERTPDPYLVGEVVRLRARNAKLERELGEAERTVARMRRGLLEGAREVHGYQREIEALRRELALRLEQLARVTTLVGGR